MILPGDCLTLLKSLDADSVDAVITDPPFGIAFMGKNWDKALPSIDVWKECLRVLKPGAWLMVMSAPRSDVQSRMVINIEDAGFRVDFTPIYWAYASGFPKAGNVSKLLDKRMGAEREVVGKTILKGNAAESCKEKGGTYVSGKSLTGVKEIDITAPATEKAKEFDGAYTGFQPKPALEIILVCMKPLSEKTYVDQVLANGKGCTWLDEGRIPYESEGDVPRVGFRKTNREKGLQSTSYGGESDNRTEDLIPNPSGRFPANLLVSDDVLNDGKVARKSSQRSGSIRHKSMWNSTNGRGIKCNALDNYGDSGSFSRYFDLDSWCVEKGVKDTFPFLIVPKPSKAEKNAGCEGLEEKDVYERNSVSKSYEGLGSKAGTSTNHHPTCKPIRLMAYLITLSTRKGDLVVDPFCGSGTTCIAAKDLGRRFIGIEREAEYVAIANARLKANRTTSPKPVQNNDGQLDWVEMMEVNDA